MATYRCFPTQFNGKRKIIVSCRGPECTALVALINFSSLQADEDVKKPILHLDEGYLIHKLTSGLRKSIANFVARDALAYRNLPKKQEKLLELVASLSHSDPLVDPINKGIKAFVENDGWMMFRLLGVRLLHGWLLDPKEKCLEDIRNCTYSGLRKKLYESDLVKKTDQGAMPSEASSSNVGGDEEKDPFMDKFIDFMASSEDLLTKHGLSLLQRAVEDGHFSVLYIRNQFRVVYKWNGDLFTLETDEHKLPDFMWKRLAVDEEQSFYMTGAFTPTKGQQNADFAQAWVESKMSELEDPNSAKGKKPQSSNINVGDRVRNSDKIPKSEPDLEDVEEASRSETCGPSTPHEASPSVADDFHKFLTEFQDGNIPYFQGIIEGMKHNGVFRWYIPYELIEKFDRKLAISIANDYPRNRTELVESAVKYLRDHGIDNDDAHIHTELALVGAPNSIKTLLQFIQDNQIVVDCKLYGDVMDTITTYAGRRMGLGYLHQILDKFEEGLCWTDELIASEMEVVNDTEFVITRAPNAPLELNRCRSNLQNYCEILFPHYKGKHTKGCPLYFDAFHTDILHMPDPEKSPERWKIFLRYLRSPLALKAPVTRSTLLCNIHRALSVPITLKSSDYPTLTINLSDPDWRLGPRKIWPLKRVYEFMNNISRGYSQDKWCNTHWHVVKFSRHFIEHVFKYLKINDLTRDLSFAELMVSKHLAEYIAKAIKAIVHECGFDGVLHSIWSSFEGSDCKDILLQLLPEENVHQQDEMTEAMIPEVSDKLVVRITSLETHNTSWAYTELGSAFSPSSDKSVQKSSCLGDRDLSQFKEFLLSQNLRVESSSDKLSRDEYILISKILSTGYRSSNYAEVSVDGPFCPEFGAVLSHLSSWMSM